MSSMEANKEIIDELHEAGLKVTSLRQEILSLLAGAHSPLSVQELSSLIEETDFNQASLFRCLKNLNEKGLIRSVDLGEGFVRYEKNCHKHSHHHHIMCRKCKSIEVLPFCISKEIQSYLNGKGFSEVEHRMDFSGICQKCRK